MLARLIIQSTISFTIMALLLFVSAGTFNWPGAWIFLLEEALSGYLLAAWLFHYDPELLKERLKSPMQREQKTWDKILMLIFFVLLIAWLVIIGCDAKRYQLSYVPWYLQIVGAMGVAVCMYVCYLVFKENTFAAPVVKVQTQRHQTVITTGPYRFVRHPMYAGMLFFLAGTPLLLGSWWGLLWALLLIMLLGARAVLEETTLRTELPGYTEYTKKVCYRFIPYIW